MTATVEKKEAATLSCWDKKDRVGDAELKAWLWSDDPKSSHHVCVHSGPREGAVMPASVLSCTPVLLLEFPRCYFESNFSCSWGWFCIQKLPDINRCAWMCELVDGCIPRGYHFQPSGHKEETRERQVQIQPASWNQEAIHGHWNVPHVWSGIYRGIFPSLRFCLNVIHPFAILERFRNIYDDRGPDVWSQEWVPSHKWPSYTSPWLLTALTPASFRGAVKQTPFFLPFQTLCSFQSQSQNPPLPCSPPAQTVLSLC